MINYIKVILSAPLSLGYILFVLLGLLFVVYGRIGASIEKRRSILGDMTTNKQAVGFLDLLLNKIPFIVRYEENLDKRLDLLELNYTARKLMKVKIAFGFSGVLLAIHLRNAMAVIPLVIIFINVPTTFIEMRVKKRLHLYDEQILESFQLFISEFTTTKSVQKTIVAISPKLNYPIRKEFERLGRKLNSGESPESCFMDFAERTENKWTMIFSQMLITYFETGADFSDQLLNITTNITDEKILEQQNDTELSSIRLTNIVMNALVPVAYIAARIINPEDSRVFVETPTGKFIMFGVVMAILISLTLGQKISEH